MYSLPSQIYQKDVSSGLIQADPAQQQALEKLDAICLALTGQNAYWVRTKQLLGLHKPVRGLYLWGDVGRGKTYLMDIFFRVLPLKRKMRLHFHRFMQRVHLKLKTLQVENKKDPLKIIANELSREARVLCFDEFFVEDVTDAMILARLISGLIANGVTLIATSNIEPDKLYQNGVHRDRFIPAIEAIKQQTDIFYLSAEQDYRLRTLTSASLYYSPNNKAATQSLDAMFRQLAPEPVFSTEPIEINQREVMVIKETDDVLWVEFAEMCAKPRGQNDYIELAKEYHSVLLSNVPQFSEQTDDQARRFISLVDEFYDRKVKLVMTAATPIESLYQGKRLAFEFERTQSRLIEMQSQDYLALEHKG